MPGKISKTKGGYATTWGGKKTAKRTSKKKAQKQLNLLRAEEHGWKPTRRKK